MRSPLIHIIGSLLLLASVVAVYGVWYSVVSGKSQHVAEVQNKIEDAEKNANRIALARAALAEISDDEASVRSYFVPESGVVEFINGLEKLGTAQKSEVKVLSVSTAGSAAQPILTLSLSIHGTFDSVMRTVGAIEYAPFDLWVTRLSVVHDKERLWRAELSLNVGSAPAATTTGRTR